MADFLTDALVNAGIIPAAAPPVAADPNDTVWSHIAKVAMANLGPIVKQAASNFPVPGANIVNGQIVAALNSPWNKGGSKGNTTASDPQYAIDFGSPGATPGGGTAAAVTSDPQIRPAAAPPSANPADTSYDWFKPTSSTDPVGALNEFTARVIQHEAGGTGDPGIKNPRSSAQGLGQFTDDTWRDVMAASHPELTGGKTAAQIKADPQLNAQVLALKTNPALSVEAIGTNAKINSTVLSNAGLPITPTTLGVLHGLGSGDGPKVLNAPSNTPLSKLLSPKVMTANPNFASMTAGGYVASMRNTYEPTGASPYNVVSPGVSSDPYKLPNMLTPDPAAEAALVPNAPQTPHIALPGPIPQEDMPGNLTAPTYIDPKTFLAPLAAAEQVKPIDTSGFANDRMVSMLAAAASAAGSMAAPRVGQLIAAAGGAAGAAFEGTKKEQQDKQDRFQEMVRQANITMAQAGMNVNLQNLGLQNAFAEKQDARADLKRTTKFANEHEAFSTLLDLAMHNSGIDTANADRVQRTASDRANVQIAGINANASTANEATKAQTELSIRQAEAGATGAAMANTTGQILDNVSVPRVSQQGKDDPLNDNAREAAQAIASVRVAKADPGMAESSILGNFGKELVLNGNYTRMPNAAAIAKVLYPSGQGPGAKAPTPQAIEQAAGMVTQGLTADKPSAYKLAKILSVTQNAPVARIIASRLKPVAN